VSAEYITIKYCYLEKPYVLPFLKKLSANNLLFTLQIRMTNDTRDENLVVAGNEMEFSVEDNHDMFDDEYEEHGSNNEDDEFLDARQKKKQMNNELLDELGVIRVENNDNRDGFNELFDELDT